MSEISEEELIHDWNQGTWPMRPPLLIDHTLPAALLSPARPAPPIQEQAQILRELSKLGLEAFCIGCWSEEKVQNLHAALSDLEATLWVECTSRYRPQPEQLRVYVTPRQSNWQSLLQQYGARATLVLQDVTRTHPEQLLEQLATSVLLGVESICLCDDSGRATPWAAAKLVNFTLDAGHRLHRKIRVEWSGRNDRGLALYNALSAWRAGAESIHCAFFSQGEGAGLVATEQLLVNLSLLGALKRDLRHLGEVSLHVSKVLQLELYANLPIVGVDAFRTATGVHAAAILKAQRKGHDWLADLIYSGVPARLFGFEQRIEVGPMAGASNVQHWLRKQNLEATPERIQQILSHAKSCERVLSDQELHALLRSS